MNNQNLTTAFQHDLETNEQWYEVINYEGFSVDEVKYSTEEEAVNAAIFRLKKQAREVWEKHK